MSFPGAALNILRVPRRHRRLSLLLLLALALEATSARADWTGDEAHRDKLRKRLATLKTAIAAYERDRRQMDMIRASVAAMKLPFADPAFDPAKLVRRVLPRRFVGVEVVSATAKRLKGGDATLERWRVRCTLRGDYGTLLHVVAVLPLGFYLAWLAQRTQSLAVPVTGHVFNNAAAVLGSVYFAEEAASQEALDWWWAPIGWVVCAGCVALVWWTTRRREG